jgi:hypothetical protein
MTEATEQRLALMRLALMRLALTRLALMRLALLRLPALGELGGRIRSQGLGRRWPPVFFSILLRCMRPGTARHTPPFNGVCLCANA